MSRIDFISDKTGGLEEAHGSDGRVNVSSRSDTRGYYNSRDESESYVLTFDDANASANDYVVYLKNDKTDGKHMVIVDVDVHCEATTSAFKLSLVTGTAAGGTAVIPVNLNQAGVAKSSTSTSLATADSSVTPMSGLTESKVFGFIGIDGPYGGDNFRVDDRMRIGQDQAIAIELEYTAAADVRCFGSIVYFFE